MDKFNSDGVMNHISNKISHKLNEIGIMFRIFSRTKERHSLEKKLNSSSDYGISKKLQDLIGIRVVLYFNDDIDTVRNIISSIYSERSTDVSIDEHTKDEFKAVRYNIVYNIDPDNIKRLNLGSESSRIDTTFELQIRTIFSEGWHEVEHDLRYKCNDDWKGFDSHSRRLNGVYASLETSEWTMIKIFDELAYSHYKNQEWPAMFRQKFRLRFTDSNIDDDLNSIFKDTDLAKRFFRLDRQKILLKMCEYEFYYPVTISNLIYFCNLIEINDSRILELTPSILIEDINSSATENMSV
jgi:ppGpp synthetase/RelA/SpoT-type nucleotidyltranferase